MRIAALAFGVLAGLVASFILALGGLDAAELRHLDGRQMQLVTFGLFVVANLARHLKVDPEEALRAAKLVNAGTKTTPRATRP